jgi:hypothetical protein
MRWGGAVLLAMLVAGCGNDVEGAPVAAHANGRDSVLVTDAELDELLRVNGFRTDSERRETVDELAAGTRPPGCVGTLRTAEAGVYHDADPTSVLIRTSGETGKGELSVEQSAVNTVSPAKAQRVLQVLRITWKVCADNTLVTTSAGTTQSWRLEPLRDRDDIVSQKAVDSTGRQCQHAVAAAGATVVEALVCGTAITDQGIEVVTALLANVSPA